MGRFACRTEDSGFKVGVSGVQAFSTFMQTHVFMALNPRRSPLAESFHSSWKLKYSDVDSCFVGRVSAINSQPYENPATKRRCSQDTGQVSD